jgi:hypothetical protein
VARKKSGRRKGYTVVQNEVLRDENLSLKAKGMYALMVALPDGWDYSIKGLASLSKDGRDSTAQALSELENHGYIYREKCTDSNGRFSSWKYEIGISPCTEKPCTEKPNTEKPCTEKPCTENPSQINKEELIKEELIKEELIKDVVVSAETRDIGNEDEKLSLLKGEWQGLMLSDKQMDDLIDRMGIEVFEEYAKRMSAFIERTGARGFNHHRKMLQWYAQDTQI